MKKKKETAVSPGKNELKKELKKKSSALEKLKRELKIEAALEEVRARAMAMHHTSELQEVVNILAQQLYNINIDINGGVSICINDEVDKDIPLWASSGATNYMQKVVVPLLDKPILTRIKNAIKKRNNFFVEEYSKEEKMEFFKHLSGILHGTHHHRKEKSNYYQRKEGIQDQLRYVIIQALQLIITMVKNFLTKKMKSSNALQKFSNKPIRVFLISKKQKSRQENLKFN